MPALYIFLCGFGGSIAVEVVVLYQHYHIEPLKLPERYKMIGFWIVRLFLAVVGGGLAMAYEIDKPLLAANIGAATPLIIKAFAEGLKPAITTKRNSSKH
jgi:hypothetical protein